MRVCVPIKIEECDQFNPLAVPNLHTISQELSQTNEKKAKNTSLKPYLDYFEKFVMDMILDVKRAKRGKEKK